MDKILIATLSALLFSAPVLAADDMAGMDMSHPSSDDAFAPSMMKMHKAMGAVTPTGNVDVDFVQGMIPHHQGAIDMAKVELEQGKDPEIKKLAQDIINAQEVEIKQMNDWLKKHKSSSYVEADLNRITEETSAIINSATSSAIKADKELDVDALAIKLKSVKGVENAHANETGSSIVVQINDDTFITMAVVTDLNAKQLKVKTPIPSE